MTQEEYDAIKATLEAGDVAYHGGRSVMFEADLEFLCAVYEFEPKSSKRKKKVPSPTGGADIEVPSDTDTDAPDSP
jgi:hypothetical protein